MSHLKLDYPKYCRQLQVLMFQEIQAEWTSPSTAGKVLVGNPLMFPYKIWRNVHWYTVTVLVFHVRHVFNGFLKKTYVKPIFSYVNPLKKQQLTVIRKTHVPPVGSEVVIPFSTWQIQVTEENHHQTLLMWEKKCLPDLAPVFGVEL